MSTPFSIEIRFDNTNLKTNSALMLLGRIRKAFTDALFPAFCMDCGEFVEPGPNGQKNILPIDILEQTAGELFREIMAPFLCGTCCERFVPIVPPVCPVCGLQFVSRVGDDHRCGGCIDRKKPFLSAKACGQYDGSLMTIIHAYKYRGRIRLARPLGALLYLEYLRHFAGIGIDCVVPVPLHPAKLRQRGFNQVLLMLDQWKKIAPGFKIPIEANLLVRTRNTESQTGLGKKERRKNIRNAFTVNNPSRIEGRAVLLVDDVYTTGATLEECAAILSRAGATAVYILTLARAM